PLGTWFPRRPTPASCLIRAGFLRAFSVARLRAPAHARRARRPAGTCGKGSTPGIPVIRKPARRKPWSAAGRRRPCRRHFMTHHIICRLTVSTLALLPLGSTTVLADDKDKLIGSWKLVSAVSEDLANGQKTNIYEGSPTGFISYGVDGRVMTIIAGAAR